MIRLAMMQPRCPNSVPTDSRSGSDDDEDFVMVSADGTVIEVTQAIEEEDDYDIAIDNEPSEMDAALIGLTRGVASTKIDPVKKKKKKSRPVPDAGNDSDGGNLFLDKDRQYTPYWAQFWTSHLNGILATLDLRVHFRTQLLLHPLPNQDDELLDRERIRLYSRRDSISRLKTEVRHAVGQKYKIDLESWLEGAICNSRIKFIRPLTGVIPPTF